MEKETAMTLSPAAQAVLDAANNSSAYGPEDCLNEARQIAAAALRAVADQVVPPTLEEEFYDRNHALPLQKKVEIRQKLNAIADELEAQ
jgi:hypothetical protein